MLHRAAATSQHKNHRTTSSGEHSMATIIKRPGPKNSIVWQAQVRKKGYPSQIKTFDRKGDAQKWAKGVEHEMEVGLWKNAKEASQFSLSQAIKRYLASVTPRKRPATQKSELLSARSLKEFMGSLSLLQVTPEKVAEYRDKRLKSVSANTVRIELALLSNLFNIAEREWSFRGLDNPVQHINKPKVPEGRYPILSEEQIKRLLEECKKIRSKLLYPFVLLALHTGCRSMELRKLRWPQVSLEEGYISLVGTETKIHRSRIVPLTPAAKEVLQSLKTTPRAKKVVDIHGKPKGLIFPAKGHPDRPRDMHMGFNQAVRRAGLDNLPGIGKFRIHDLRHLCGTFLVMTGGDLETVRSILGHRDLSTTQRYLHMANEHKMKTISKIGHLGMGKSNSAIP
jgi:integrase